MHQISVGGLVVDIVRKNIKNLHLGVYPPEGRVRVAAPLRVNDEAVRLAVISKLAWIKRQRSRFKLQERQSAREYVSRESHYYLGRRYLLNVIEHDGHASVEVRNKTFLDLYVPKRADTLKREQALLSWYRKELKVMARPMFEKWEAIVGVEVANWGVKRMKTKWGSCNSDARRIWLNLELIKKPAQCLEYIVVHEMVHLLERHHNDRFTGLMDKFMPRWRLHRDELNRVPLAHETWSY
ncbi:MAG TPA: SprT family zinc-dependent metalloprotease [Acidiferrobacterales bacterium]|nr:SprT family zinc-dependent metalloprotease [Acidiferrobacterales bacterium]